MKILMLGLIDPQKNDAGKIHFFELAYSFAKMNHQLCCIIPKGDLDKKFSEKLKIIRLAFNVKDNFLFLFLLNLMQFYLALKELKNTYDIIYIRFRLLPCFFLKLCSVFYRKFPSIIVEHPGWVEREMKIEGYKPIAVYIGKKLQLWDAYFSDMISAMTEGTAEMLINNGISKKKVKVIQNGTNLDHYYPLLSEIRLALRKNLLNIDDNSIILGFMGNISKWQGIEDLLNVFLDLYPKYSIRLLIIGSGKHLDDLKKQINNTIDKNLIIFKQNIPYQDMNLWNNCIDIAFAPKISELDGFTSPLKLRDYAACGKAVISTNIRGIKEFNEFGWLKTYEFNNLQQLKALIEPLLKQPQLLTEMSLKARIFAEEHFSWDKVAEKTLNSLNSLKETQHDSK